jgi:hypothetical protein
VSVGSEAACSISAFSARWAELGKAREGHNRGQVLDGEATRIPGESRLLTGGSRSSARNKQNRVTNDHQAFSVIQVEGWWTNFCETPQALFLPNDWTQGNGSRSR